MKFSYVLIACLFVSACLTQAYGQNSKEKKYSGRFAASQGKLIIDNRYGKLDINTWDRNEVTVDITVRAKSVSAAAAQDILDKVRIQEPKDNLGDIVYKTVIEPRKSDVGMSQLTIDYVINMPKRQAASFTNKYGDIEIADVDGPLDIDLKYGKLTANAMRGESKSIQISYGSATIPSIESGTITVAYSKLSITKAGKITVANKYEKTTIGTVRDLVINQKYGDLKIGSVNELTANLQFAGLDVEKLLKGLTLNISYGSGVHFDFIGPEVDNIRVQSSYTNSSYRLDKNANLSGNLSVSYGNVRNSNGSVTLAGPDSDKGHSANYNMKIGSGKGSMVVSASYGNVELR